MDSLGHVHHQLGDHGAALAHYTQALELRRALGDRPAQATTLDHIATTHAAAGDPAAAHAARQQAATLRGELPHPPSR